MDTDRSETAGSELTFSRARWRAARPFALVASAAVVVGGLVAAITGPIGLERGSWGAAYLVLVVGVGQFVLGVGQAALSKEPPSPRQRGWQLTGYNAGSSAVLIGTTAEVPALVLAGGALLLLALVLFLAGTRGAPAGPWTVVYRLVAAVLAVSIPIGLVLAVRGG